jgi:N-ethylmaleimide reductase
MSDLFSPLTLGSLTLPNRIVMAPMTRNRAPETVPTALMSTYYVQRAQAGLLITEGSQISSEAVGYPATPGIHTDAQEAGWKKVTDAVHAQKGRIFLQLWHCGRASHPDFHGGALPVSSSAIQPKGQTFTPQGLKDLVTPRALTLDEIPRVIADYAHAAERAKRAGFDGVEIHGANGYLIDQFLRDGSNKRTDNYGGSLENRTRFLLDVTQAVVNVLGADRVGVRLSPLQPFNDMFDSNPQTTFTYAVEQLNRFGLAYLHITEMGQDTPGVAGPGFDLSLLRQCWKGVYITNGAYDKARGNAAIAKGAADAIAFGVPFLANPDLVKRLELDAALNVPDQSTFYGGDEHGYTDYPALSNDKK